MDLSQLFFAPTREGERHEKIGRMLILLICIAAVTGTVANAAPQKGKGGDEEGVLSWPPERKGVLTDI